MPNRRPTVIVVGAATFVLNYFSGCDIEQITASIVTVTFWWFVLEVGFFLLLLYRFLVIGEDGGEFFKPQLGNAVRPLDRVVSSITAVLVWHLFWVGVDV